MEAEVVLQVREDKLPFVVSKKPVLAGGMLSKYADKTKWKKENKALEKGIIEEYAKIK